MGSASAAAAATAAAATAASGKGGQQQQHVNSSTATNDVAGADGLPMEVGIYAQEQVRRQQSLERGDNVRDLGELLMGENDDQVPEMYHPDSDADEFAASFVANSSGGEGGGGVDGDDESLRSLEAELLR